MGALVAMIRISLGNVGSGKTASEVRELYLRKDHITTYSNIKTSVKGAKLLTHDMILKKEQVSTKKTKQGETAVYDFKVNVDFWQKVEKPLRIVLDEAHSITNARRSFSKINVVMNDWLSLIRRVVGQSESSQGEVVFITQLPNRIDSVIRDMATQIRYHLCHFHKRCLRCGSYWKENSDMPETLEQCPHVSVLSWRSLVFRLRFGIFKICKVIICGSRWGCRLFISIMWFVILRSIFLCMIRCSGRT